MTALLSLADVHTYTGQFHILQGVSMEVPPQGVTVLLGRNGAGKTTTLRTIMGLCAPSGGRIFFAGESVGGLPPYLAARRGLGYVPEDRGVFTTLTVEENLRLAERDKGALRQKQDYLFSLFPDLQQALKRRAGALSGGQQQMLAIARVLVNPCRLLLVDEPSKGLAPIVVERVAAALNGIKGETPILLVEQNFVLARAVGDRYVLIDDGITVGQGDMAALVADEELKRKYLGVA